MIETLRWSECDAQPEPIAQLNCRTTRLASALHHLQRRVARVEWQQRFLLAGAFSAIATGVVTVLRFLHDVGAF